MTERPTAYLLDYGILIPHLIDRLGKIDLPGAA